MMGSIVATVALLVVSPDLFQLADGREVAGKVIHEDALEVQVATFDGPVTLDPREILGRISAATLLPLFRQTFKDACQRGPVALYALATWCEGRGLEQPLLDTLDRLLEREPEHAGAGALAASLSRRAVMGGPLDVTALDATAIEGYVRRFEATGPGRRAIMVQRLLGAGANDDIPAALLRVVRQGRLPARLLAIELLGVSRPPQALQPLLLVSITDLHIEARQAAARAVKSFGEPEVVFPLMRTLMHPRSAYRTAAMDALETLGDQRAVGALIANLGPLPAASLTPSGGGAYAPRNHIFVGRQKALVTDYDVEIASNAVIADPQVSVVQEGTLLDVRVLGVSTRRSLPERLHTVRVLRRLTDQDFGTSHEQWKRWWATHKQDSVAPASATGAH
ncbi:MAG: HEAT repeat domain-containing protein [Planctomycetota bacterium]